MGRGSELNDRWHGAFCTMSPNAEAAMNWHPFHELYSIIGSIHGRFFILGAGAVEIEISRIF
jgi:hypothetical protein